MKLPCKWIIVGGKKVGYVKAITFFKFIKFSKHMLRFPPAICLQVSSINDAIALGARRVRVTNLENKKQYQISFRKIQRVGSLLDRGHGQQAMTELKHWKVL